MIFEFQKTRIRLIIFSLLLVALSTLLFIIQTGLIAILLLLVISFLMIFYYLKRVAIHEIMQLNKLLLEEQKVVDYILIYEDLNQRFYTKDARWIVTKKHNLVLGYIFSGDLKKAAHLLTDVEDKYSNFLKSFKVFNYMQNTLKMMISIIKADSYQVKKEYTSYLKSFESNDDKTKEQIQANRKSFHNWILSMYVLLTSEKSEEESLIIANEMQKTLKALAIYALNIKKLTKENPQMYCSQCFHNDVFINK